MELEVGGGGLNKLNTPLKIITHGYYKYRSKYILFQWEKYKVVYCK
jgi:hypothetical protein